MRELRPVRPEAESPQGQGRLVRRPAGCRLDHAGTRSERLLAAEILALLSEPDLTDLEEVTPPLRLIQGGRA